MKAILKQTSWLVLAQILTKVIGFFYTIFLAKSLGVEDFGLFSVALAYFSIISAFTDFGFNRYLIREVSRDKGNISEILCNVAILRLTLASVFFGIFAVTLYILDPDKIRVSLILIAALAILPQSVGFTYESIFVALRKVQFPAIALLLSSITTAFIGFSLVSRGFGSIGAVNALIIGQLIYALVLIAILFQSHGLLLSKIRTLIIKAIMLGSLPYGILAVIGLVSFKADTIILSYFKGNFETGIYGAAFKFLEAAVFIPAALATASFPVFTKLLSEDLSAAKKIYFKSIILMLGLGLCILFIYILILPAVMKFLLPNYLSSIEALKILSLSIPFIFMHILSNQVLLSTEKYLKPLIGMYVVLFFINLILYLIFIPQFGFKAAAWITVLSEIMTFLTFFQFLRLKVFKDN